MFFDFLKEHKTKTLLVAAGFLVLACFSGLIFWFYDNFLMSRDPFLEMAPAESAVYWHSSFPEGADDLWLRIFSERILAGQSEEEAEFLFQNVGPDVSEMSFSLLHGFEDFIFWGKVIEGRSEVLKEKLEKENFNYILEDDGRITVTNTKFALGEILAVLGGKSDSLADEKIMRLAWNHVNRRSAAQIYFKDNFKLKNFDALTWQSDFWDRNTFSVGLGPDGGQPQSLLDFDWLFETENRDLFKNSEKLLKNNLAIFLPEIKERILPDKTVVREIVANPALFTIEKQIVCGQEISHLPVSEIGQDFFVARSRKIVIVSNSGQKIGDYLADLKPRPDYYGKNLTELVFDWLKWLAPDFGGVVFGVEATSPNK